MCQKKIRTKISALKKYNYVKEVNEVLRSNECLQSLEELYNQFVIVPIDKASGNIAFEERQPSKSKKI